MNPRFRFEALGLILDPIRREEAGTSEAALTALVKITDTLDHALNL